MSARTTSEVSRWLRVGLLLLPLLMGATLVGGAWSNRQRTLEASELLIRGQVDWFLRAVAETLRGAEGAPDAALLAEMLEQLEPDGLRYVALSERDGTPKVAAGLAQAHDGTKAPVRDSVRITRTGQRVVVATQLPLHRSRPPPRGPSRFRFDKRLPAPLLVMELEPVVADRLRNDADRAFALSAVTALVLMLVAGMLWWQLRRRELQVASLEHERRLAQLGEMSAVLAHEMRNPLASLKGNAQLLLEQLPSESREAKKAERVVSEATRLEALSRTLLDFVRSGSVERRPVDVVSLLRHAIDEVGPDRVELTTQGDVGRPVKLDSLRMNQVLVNLLENALDVSSDNQPVEVALEVRGQTLRVEVRDSGPGLEPGDEAKIFEAFHTKKTHGTGLGLAIARRIVQMHGGTLTARNHPEAGAVFVVELPG